jgi:CRISPR-associated protein Csb2
MPTALLISVRFHDGRYHGRGDWPPAPARLFQALVAGAAQGEALSPEDLEALAWLETLAPPVIAAPPKRDGQGFRNFVPNNDLDAVGGDPRRVGEIRAAKLIRPVLFDAALPLVYAWTFEDAADANTHAGRLCSIAERLYQLGRGVDMAWGWAEVLPETEALRRLDGHGGAIHRPGETGDGTPLAVPLKGSLDSLVCRHRSTRTRFRSIRELRPTAREPHREVEIGRLFAQPPKPRFRQVAYDSPSRRLLFDLVDADGKPSSWRLDRIVPFTVHLRDAAVQRLKTAFQGQDEKTALIDRILVGRDAAEADKAQRVRIAPLPSIGHRLADHAIRRVLVEVPAGCPLRADDLAWAFSGLPLRVSGDGEVLCELAPAADRGMLAHYGIADAHAREGQQPSVDAASLWRTVTPAALPQHAARRRIDPARKRAQVKAGAERLAEETAAAEAAASALAQALRHAGVAARPQAIRVQREPFEARGARAEAFAPDTRFAKERLWHVEVALDAAQRGPLVIGDGRYLGLGLMEPAQRADGVLAFAIEDGLAGCAEPAVLTRALRRAALARAQAALGDGRQLPLYITGHEADGGPSRRGGAHQHIAFAYEEAHRRLLILAPHALERRPPWPSEGRSWSLVQEAMRDLTELRAGAAGKLRLTCTSLDVASSALFAPARHWESATPYRVLRHRRLADAAAALAADVTEECRRLRLPRVVVEVLEARGVAGVGLTGRARLRFATAVAGPILIGRDRHFGGGLFAGCPSRRD